MECAINIEYTTRKSVAFGVTNQPPTADYANN